MENCSHTAFCVLDKADHIYIHSMNTDRHGNCMVLHSFKTRNKHDIDVCVFISEEDENALFEILSDRRFQRRDEAWRKKCAEAE